MLIIIHILTESRVFSPEIVIFISLPIGCLPFIVQYANKFVVLVVTKKLYPRHIINYLLIYDCLFRTRVPRSRSYRQAQEASRRSRKLWWSASPQVGISDSSVADTFNFRFPVPFQRNGSGSGLVKTTVKIHLKNIKNT